jgi:hypothetical protein
MRTTQVSLTHIQCRLDEGEPFHAKAFAQVATTVAMQRDIHNVDLILTAAQYSESRMDLQELGFWPAGSMSVDNQQFMLVRKSLRRSGDGVLDIKGPSSHPSDVELQARAEWYSRNPECMRLGREFAESQGLKPLPQLPPSSVEIEREINRRPVEVDGKPFGVPVDTLTPAVDPYIENPPVGSELPQITDLKDKAAAIYCCVSRRS